jgi:hypothetical protein
MIIPLLVQPAGKVNDPVALVPEEVTVNAITFVGVNGPLPPVPKKALITVIKLHFLI